MEASFLVPAASRRSIRREVRLSCEVVREQGFRLLGRRALDLSTTGIRVAALDARDPVSSLSLGEGVVLAFRGPSGRWFDAEGRIARIVHGRRAEDCGPSVAISFASLDEELRKDLRKDFAKCRPAPARRPHRIDYAATIRRIATS
jgi:hypothetical protein